MSVGGSAVFLAPMINLPAALTAAMTVVAPPGTSKYSIVPYDCHADTCETAGARWSEYYQAWTVPETPVQATARYARIGEAAVEAARIELCRPPSGDTWDDCRPYPGAQGWSVVRLTSAAIGVAVIESGLREDVMVGRGRCRHPDEAGGEGRGPGGEVCLMQVHPTIAWAFVPGYEPVARTMLGSTAATREDVAVSLLGADHDHLVQCFRTGMRMLIQANSYCAWDWSRRKSEYAQRGFPNMARADPWWEMFSMYGTGTTCGSSNGTKTSIRTTTSYRLLGQVQANLRRQQAQEQQAAL